MGPLQLLNYAFKKGALSDAMKESNDIEAIHEDLERQMEQTYGVSDYQSIRRAILKEKARQKTKADYDENTFDDETSLLSNDICRRDWLETIAIARIARWQQLLWQEITYIKIIDSIAKSSSVEVPDTICKVKGKLKLL